MTSVTTIQGDTWDTVAKRVYGDERRAEALMECRDNIRLLDMQVFPGGICISTPELPDDSAAYDLPEWRR